MLRARLQRLADIHAQRGHAHDQADPADHAEAPGRMTRTSWRSLRRSATVHSPPEIRSMAIACSAGTRSRPFSQSLMWPRELRPKSRARSSCDQFRVFRSRTSFIAARVRIIRRLSQLDSFGLSGPTI
jgi:hypothetical protein